VKKRLANVVPVVVQGLRLTIPAREALERAGNSVVQTHTPDGSRYSVEIIRPPVGLVLVRVGGKSDDFALRMANEPPWPGEWPSKAIAWWDRGDWVPCPGCGYGLVWNEAGYVPGWRICLAGHAAQLAADGRSAKRMT